jgi:hypothetical protein
MRQENQDKLNQAIKLITEVLADQPEGTNLRYLLSQALQLIKVVLPFSSTVMAVTPIADGPEPEIDNNESNS